MLADDYARGYEAQFIGIRPGVFTEASGLGVTR